MTVKILPPRTDEPEEIRRYREQLVSALNIIDGRVSAAESDSTATALADMVTDFNSLLAKLRTAGLIVT